MAEAMPPGWWTPGLRPEHAKAIQELFVQLLSDLPMPQNELASQSGVAHTTVGRWARGERNASLEHMLRAVQVTKERLDNVKGRVDRSRLALEAVEAVQTAWDSGDLHELVKASQRVGEVLQRQEGRVRSTT